MTYFEAQELIENEQKQNYYSTSPLNCGTIQVLKVGEDGFLYRRETEYIEVLGIAEMLFDNFTVDIDEWSISEMVVHRKN